MLPDRLQFVSIRFLTVTEVWLLHHHWRPASEQLVLHLHIAEVRLWILVYLDSSLRPHLEVIVDLMFAKRLIYLRPLLVDLAVIYVLVVHRRLHAQNRGVLEVVIWVLTNHLQLLVGSPTILWDSSLTLSVLLAILSPSPVLDLAHLGLLLKLLKLT